eukprot:1395350-Amorphochlora_amoeboformis.AAC.1
MNRLAEEGGNSTSSMPHSSSSHAKTCSKSEKYRNFTLILIKNCAALSPVALILASSSSFGVSRHFCVTH